MMILEGTLLVAAYCLGAVPFGALIARRRGVDILKHGSGNIGATNVHRVLGKAAGLTVTVLDVLKGLVPALAAKWLIPDTGHSLEWAFWIGMAAVVGHCFSPFLGWRGGKGISTSCGVLLGTSWPVACGVLAVFIAITALTRYVSLASVVAAGSVAIFGLIFGHPAPLIWAYVALFIFVVHRHRHNIKRLLAGTERKFSLKGATEGRDTVAPPGPDAEVKAVVGIEEPTAAE